MNWAEKNTGQIQLSQGLGQWIQKYAASPDFTRYLEIGSWNGRGSTICFAAGFEKRPFQNYEFRSMETDSMRLKESRDFWASDQSIQILHGRILSDDQIPTFDMVHSALGTQIVTAWHEIDMMNFRSATFQDMNVFRPQVVLLDGGEYMTYFEFQALRDIADIFLLDDTEVMKCRKIVEELKSDPLWEFVAGSSTERNGWQVFQRKR